MPKTEETVRYSGKFDVRPEQDLRIPLCPKVLSSCFASLRWANSSLGKVMKVSEGRAGRKGSIAFQAVDILNWDPGPRSRPARIYFIPGSVGTD